MSTLSKFSTEKALYDTNNNYCYGNNCHYLSHFDFTGLWGIINNVTAFIPGHCEYQTGKSIEDLVARNFTSMITLTQMFLPLIRKINGRVVNVVNLQGIVILKLMFV